jgi:ACS family tartrate transporter-like MFS transporter
VGFARSESRLLEKIAWRLIPFLGVLFFISFLDRVNIGFAALTMNQERGISPSRYGLGAGIFFLGYMLFELPSNLILARVGARIWIARIMVTWGVIAAAMAFVQGPLSFCVLRFLLGVAEAGFFPGIIFYLTLWFPARFRATAMGAFLLALPLSSALGAPLSAALLDLNIAGLRGWQSLFLIEGLPAVLLGVVVFRRLADGPENATWLTDPERSWLLETLAAEPAGRAGPHLSTLRQSLTDPTVLAFGVSYFGILAGLYGVGYWAPQMVAAVGSLSHVQIGLLTLVPYLIATAGMFAWGRHSDANNERTWHVSIAAFVGAGGLAASAYLSNSRWASLIAITLGAIGIYAVLPVFWSLTTSLLGDAAAAGRIALINSIGSIGGLCGSWAVGALRQTTGRYTAGLYLLAGLLAVSGALVPLIVGFGAGLRTSTPASGFNLND